MKIAWNIFWTIACWFIASVVMIAFLFISIYLYPMPDGVTFENKPAFREYVAGLPPMAYVIVFFSHFIGPLVGIFLAARFSTYRSVIPAIVVGCLFLLGGYFNSRDLEFSARTTAIDLALYPLATVLGIYFGRQKPAPVIAAGTP